MRLRCTLPEVKRKRFTLTPSWTTNGTGNAAAKYEIESTTVSSLAVTSDSTSEGGLPVAMFADAIEAAGSAASTPIRRMLMGVGP